LLPAIVSHNAAVQEILSFTAMFKDSERWSPLTYLVSGKKNFKSLSHIQRRLVYLKFNLIGEIARRRVEVWIKRNTSSPSQSRAAYRKGRVWIFRKWTVSRKSTCQVELLGVLGFMPLLVKVIQGLSSSTYSKREAQDTSRQRKGWEFVGP
jgi:hypothetical protein